MKNLVVYYSLDGNTRFISQAIAGVTNADILELKLKKDDTKLKGFKKYFWGGKQVVTREKPELKPFDKNPRDYDLIFIGTPVWAWRHAPAIETFFSEVNLAGKKIALFCCHEGSKGKTLEKMENKLSGNEIVGKIDFEQPLQHNKDADSERAKAWANGILKNQL